MPAGLKKSIPNMLTLLRAALVCWLNLYLPWHFGELVIPITVSLLIFLTDFLDGRLARRWGCRTRFGAALDITTDFIYILSFNTQLCVFGILPLWFILVVGYKFVEFLATSLYLGKRSFEKTAFVFDIAGRTAAVLFYAIPIIIYSSYFISAQAYHIINPWLLGACTILVVISSALRISGCIQNKGRAETRPG